MTTIMHLLLTLYIRVYMHTHDMHTRIHAHTHKRDVWQTISKRRDQHLKPGLSAPPFSFYFLNYEHRERASFPLFIVVADRASSTRDQRKVVKIGQFQHWLNQPDKKNFLQNIILRISRYLKLNYFFIPTKRWESGKKYTLALKRYHLQNSSNRRISKLSFFNGDRWHQFRNSLENRTRLRNSHSRKMSFEDHLRDKLMYLIFFNDYFER